MAEQEDEIQVLEVNADTIYQQDKAMVDSQVSTAKAFPRNISKATQNAIALVTMDKETASTCTYAVPRGGKSITGPSVHLAKILAQVWGNMRVEAKVVDIGPKQITSQAVAFDLESNLAIKVEVKRSIMTRSGRMNDDMITVTGNAANSIALRNAILNVIPRAIVDKVYKSAIGTITGDLSDENKLIAKRKQVVDALKDTYNVTEEQIFQSVGKQAISHLTKEDIVTLIGVGTSIKDGDTSVEDAFKKANKTNVTPQKSDADHESERLFLLINDAPGVDILESYKSKITPEHQLAYDTKLTELKNKKASKNK